MNRRLGTLNPHAAQPPTQEGTMFANLKSRLTYGNVMSTIAIFVALGGTSYAALTITGANVKNSSLTGTDVRNSSLTGLDIKNSSITSSDVRNGSLLKQDFRSGQLPAGPTGPAGGATGATGSTGSTGAAGTVPAPEAFREVGAAGQPAFAAPFANFGSGTATAAFYKDAFGVVHLKGLVSGLSVGNVIFTLPVGFRPSQLSYFPTMTCGGYGDALINPDGSVRQRTAATGTCFSLNGITFRGS